MQEGFDSFFFEVTAKDFRGEVRLTESCVNAGVWSRFQKVPCFGLWLTAQFLAERFGRVDLNGEGIGCVEDFEEEGEAVGRMRFGVLAKHRGSMVFPEGME